MYLEQLKVLVVYSADGSVMGKAILDSFLQICQRGSFQGWNPVNNGLRGWIFVEILRADLPGPVIATNVVIFCCCKLPYPMWFTRLAVHGHKYFVNARINTPNNSVRIFSEISKHRWCRFWERCFLSLFENKFHIIPISSDSIPAYKAIISKQMLNNWTDITRIAYIRYSGFLGWDIRFCSCQITWNILRQHFLGWEIHLQVFPVQLMTVMSQMLADRSWCVWAGNCTWETL